MLHKIFKIVGQVIILYLIFIVGNFISTVLASFIAIPSGIISMFILFALLCTNVLKLSAVEETGSFLLKYMGFFFIPLIVGLLDTFQLIQDSFIQLIIILIVSCVCVMFVSAKVTDILISHFERKKTL